MTNPFPVSPLKSGEASDIQLLYGCQQIFDTSADRLKQRLRLSKVWREFRIIQSLTPKVLNSLMSTVPPDKAARFLLNLCNQEIRVCSKSALQTKPGYILIEEDNLRDLMVFGMRNACLMCDGSHQERRKCQLRRILKQTTLFEPQESDAECLGQWLLGVCEK